MENNSQQSDAVEQQPDKSIAIIAYITLIGLIAAFVMNNEKKQPFAAYHIRQSLGIMLTGLALGMINIIPILGWVVCIVGVIFLFVCWVMGLIAALNGQEKAVPVVGKYYQEWFKSV
ncbi:DUF4870 domain-containing protein [Parapedobacter indicus]|uniref:Uncharacterized membrane protein n=1 Tax=Parapedobacter indicus TaxID=1477437 RepID=A0A1I3INP2_9SPHI|nr:hypothetical protein [Parapedobacter indicus]PPL02239.1 putative membrane protein [Parapedobacter indicus]SFI49605.1 Uncharacterized membrane protein [Parapedobacter indicus]